MINNKPRASASNIWLNCSSSIIHTKKEDENENKRFKNRLAQEGTNAHELAELILKGKKFTTTDYPKEMINHTKGYCEYVRKLISGSDYHEIEKKMSYHGNSLTGTADAVILKNETIHVVDLKYGKNVKVNSYENSQLMIYAVMAMHAIKHDLMFDKGITAPLRLKKVVLHIYQPRMNNISTYTAGMQEVYHFEDVLKVKLDKILAGKFNYKIGSHCSWCKGKKECLAMRDLIFKIKEGDYMTTREDKITIALHWPEIEKTAKSITEELKQGLERDPDGNEYPEIKLVKGRKTTVYRDDAEERLLKIYRDNNLNTEELYENKLITPSVLSKIMPRDLFNENKSDLTFKKSTTTKIVPINDSGDDLTRTFDDLNLIEGLDK